MPMELLTERRGRVLLATLSDPASRNAISPDLYRQGVPLFRALAEDPEVGAIVITGAGEHFCGGGDLKRMQAQRGLAPQGQRDNLDTFHDWLMALRACPQPVVAAVEGAAAGGGFSIALACDLIVAAEDAKFVMAYVKVALTPDGGGTDSLAHMLPPQAALELLLDGNVIAAPRLHALGVVNRVVPRGDALAQALAWAERLARGPRGAQAAMKRLVYEARDRTRREQMDAERDTFLRALYADEAGEGIAAFLEKRKPAF